MSGEILFLESDKGCRRDICRLHEEGVIYRANRLVNWCLKLNTTLYNLEVHLDLYQMIQRERSFLSEEARRMNTECSRLWRQRKVRVQCHHKSSHIPSRVQVWPCYYLRRISLLTFCGNSSWKDCCSNYTSQDNARQCSVSAWTNTLWDSG